MPVSGTCRYPGCEQGQFNGFCHIHQHAHQQSFVPPNAFPDPSLHNTGVQHFSMAPGVSHSARPPPLQSFHPNSNFPPMHQPHPLRFTPPPLSHQGTSYVPQASGQMSQSHILVPQTSSYPSQNSNLVFSTQHHQVMPQAVMPSNNHLGYQTAGIPHGPRPPPPLQPSPQQLSHTVLVERGMTQPVSSQNPVKSAFLHSISNSNASSNLQQVFSISGPLVSQPALHPATVNCATASSSDANSEVSRSCKRFGFGSDPVPDMSEFQVRPTKKGSHTATHSTPHAPATETTSRSWHSPTVRQETGVVQQVVPLAGFEMQQTVAVSRSQQPELVTSVSAWQTTSGPMDTVSTQAVISTQPLTVTLTTVAHQQQSLNVLPGVQASAGGARTAVNRLPPLTKEAPLATVNPISMPNLQPQISQQQIPQASPAQVQPLNSSQQGQVQASGQKNKLVVSRRKSSADDGGDVEDEDFIILDLTDDGEAETEERVNVKVSHRTNTLAPENSQVTRTSVPQNAGTGAPHDMVGVNATAVQSAVDPGSRTGSINITTGVGDMGVGGVGVTDPFQATDDVIFLDSPEAASSEDVSEIKILETVSLRDLGITFDDVEEVGGVKLEDENNVEHSAGRPDSDTSFQQLSSQAFYRCGCDDGQCGFLTPIPTQLEVHLGETHPGAAAYPCVHCGACLLTPDQLMSHLEHHLTSEQAHGCLEHCGILFTSHEEVLKHVSEKHPQRYPFPCWQCKETFRGASAFSNHVRRNLLHVVLCPHCSGKHVDMSSMLAHIITSHPHSDQYPSVQTLLLCKDRAKRGWWDSEKAPGHTQLVHNSTDPTGHTKRFGLAVNTQEPMEVVNHGGDDDDDDNNADFQPFEGEDFAVQLASGDDDDNVGADVEREGGGSMERSVGKETEESSWVQATYSRPANPKDHLQFQCDFCDHGSATEEDHVHHVFAIHRGNFFGFACSRCRFVSADPKAGNSHACSGTLNTRTRSRRGLRQDVDANTEMASAGSEVHAGRKRKRSTSPSAAVTSKKGRRGSDAERVEDGGESSCARVMGVCRLQCKLCGLTSVSRSVLCRHLSEKHLLKMQCPVCPVEHLCDDQAMLQHFQDTHPRQLHLYEEMKVSYFAQVSDHIVEYSSKNDVVAMETDSHDNHPVLRTTSRTSARLASKKEPILAKTKTKKSHKKRLDPAKDAAKQSVPQATEKAPLQSGPALLNGQLSCKECSYVTSKLHSLHFHVMLKHLKQQCPVCKATVKDFISLHSHFRASHFRTARKLIARYKSSSWIRKTSSVVANKTSSSEMKMSSSSKLPKNSTAPIDVSKGKSTSDGQVDAETTPGPRLRRRVVSAERLHGKESSAEQLHGEESSDEPKESSDERLDGWLQCQKCTFSSRSLWYTKEHIMQTHLRNQCPVCRNPVKNFSDLYKHFQVKHHQHSSRLRDKYKFHSWLKSAGSTAPPESTHESKTSKSAAQSKSGNKTHDSSSKTNNAPTVSTSEAEHVSEVCSSGKKKLKSSESWKVQCRDCLKFYSSRQTLINHAMNKHLHHKCPVCKTRVNKFHGMYSHFEAKHKQRASELKAQYGGFRWIKSQNGDAKIQWSCKTCPAHNYMLTDGGREIPMSVYYHVMKIHIKNQCPSCLKPIASFRDLHCHFKTDHPKNARLLSNKFRVMNFVKMSVIDGGSGVKKKGRGEITNTTKTGAEKNTPTPKTNAREFLDEHHNISEKSSPDHLKVILRRIPSSSDSVTASTPVHFAKNSRSATSVLSESPIPAVTAKKLSKSSPRSKSAKPSAKCSNHSDINVKQNLRCLKCGFGNHWRAQMNKHVFEKHVKSRCPECKAPSIGFQTLNRHFKSKHPDNAQALIAQYKPERWYTCVSEEDENVEADGTVLEEDDSSAVQNEDQMLVPTPNQPAGMLNSSVNAPVVSMGNVLVTSSYSTPIILSPHPYAKDGSFVAIPPALTFITNTSVSDSGLLETPGTSYALDNSALDETEPSTCSVYIDRADQEEEAMEDGGDGNESSLHQGSATDPAVHSSGLDHSAGGAGNSVGGSVFETFSGEVCSAERAATLFFSPHQQAEMHEAQLMEEDFSDVRVCKDKTVKTRSANPNLSAQLWSQTDHFSQLEGVANEDMEYRCPHCTTDFQQAFKFYEHLCYHYHYRCFSCGHCEFLAFGRSSVFNHSQREHQGLVPSIGHNIKETMENRIYRVINTNFVQITDPYTERRLKAYARAREKKLANQQESALRKAIRAGLASAKQVEKMEAKEKLSPSKEKKGKGAKSKEGKSKDAKLSKQVQAIVASLPKKRVNKPGDLKWLICPYCRKQKKTQISIEREIRFHIHYKPFSCIYCDFTSSSLDFCQTHIEKEHPQKPQSIKYARIEAKEERFKCLFDRAVMLSSPTGTIPGTDEVPVPDQGQALVMLSLESQPSTSNSHSQYQPQNVKSGGQKTPKDKKKGKKMKVTDTRPSSSFSDTRPSSSFSDTRPSSSFSNSIISCYHCQFSFHRKNLTQETCDAMLAEHVQRVHQFSCSHCEYSSTVWQDISTHMLERHPDIDQSAQNADQQQQKQAFPVSMSMAADDNQPATSDVDLHTMQPAPPNFFDVGEDMMGQYDHPESVGYDYTQTHTTTTQDVFPVSLSFVDSTATEGGVEPVVPVSLSVAGGSVTPEAGVCAQAVIPNFLGQLQENHQGDEQEGNEGMSNSTASDAVYPVSLAVNSAYGDSVLSSSMA